MRGITVRPAGPADADAIAALLGQLGYPAESRDVPARLERLGREGRAAAFVAEDAGQVVGVVTTHVLSVINRVGDIAMLTALVVDQGARGRGVGRALVQAVEAFARRAGCERLSVTTHVDRADAHQFYARLGFDHTGRRYAKVLDA